MIDPLLLPLAHAAAACYDLGAVADFVNPLRTVHCFHTVVDELNTFAFAGTETIEEWIIDLVAVQAPLYEHPQLGWIFGGYWTNIQPVLDQIKAKLIDLGRPPFYLCGHSKGAAEAILAHAGLKDAGFFPLATRAFEPPQVGGEMLRDFVGRDVIWTQTRNTDGVDIVTMVPGGPTWFQPQIRQTLFVPDAYGVAKKHRIAAVIEALGALV